MKKVIKEETDEFLIKSRKRRKSWMNKAQEEEI